MIEIVIGCAFAYMTMRLIAGRALVKGKKLKGLPSYYGWYASLWFGIPGIVIFTAMPYVVPGENFWTPFLVIFFVMVALYMAWRAMNLGCHIRHRVEKASNFFMWSLTALTLIIIALVLSVLVCEAFKFFLRVPFYKFLFGSTWLPGISDQDIGDNFGALPLFWGTFFVTIIAFSFVLPLGIMASIYLSEYAKTTVRHTLRPILETMAGVPTVVYGFFAAIFVAPTFQKIAHALGIDASVQSALAAGTVLGLMLIPMLISLCDDVLRAVPKALREGSLGLGATQAETVFKIVLPSAKSGLVSAVLLTLSRALGETMLVVMAAGLAANLTANPFASVTTVTVQIVTLLTGDQQFDSPGTLSAFALGFVLFFITLSINIAAERLQRK